MPHNGMALQMILRVCHNQFAIKQIFTIFLRFFFLFSVKRNHKIYKTKLLNKNHSSYRFIPKEIKINNKMCMPDTYSSLCIYAKTSSQDQHLLLRYIDCINIYTVFLVFLHSTLYLLYIK